MRIYEITLFLLSITILTSCRTPPQLDTEYFGDVKLQIDDEWLMNNNGTKFIRLGVCKNPRYYYHDPNEKNYNNRAPYTNALVKSEKILKYEIYPEYQYNIDSFDIPVDENSLTIDFNFIVQKLKRDEIWIPTEYIYTRMVFFYHPKYQKWWGFYHNGISYDLEIVMYNKLYKFTNTKQDIEKLLEDTNRKTRCASIMENPILNLPSMKFYEEILGDVIENYYLFCWYIE